VPIREVRCSKPDCGTLNRVPAYSIRKIPKCGRSGEPLPEQVAVKTLRGLYQSRRFFFRLAILASPLLFFAWVGSGSHDPAIRFPALISWPGHIPMARMTDQVAISMDWMPTLLAAAGTGPDPAFPPDGMNLLPALTQNAAPVPRKLFWRYKANWQRALRDGDYKYLKILDNTFLFNVVADPMERANLIERNKEIYDRLVAEWNEWNVAMLPEVTESSTS
jgi:hypothetical protein